MTTRARNRFLLAGVMIGGIALLTLLPMLASSGPESVREIRLVTRDMSFYLEGSGEPNPTITVKAGERLRIRLRNEDAGMSHDFAVKAWGVGTRLLEDRGHEDAITIDIPAERGSTTYLCTPHPKMMTGTLRIE